MLDNEKIEQVDSFTYLGRIISKGSGCSENVKSRIARPMVSFRIAKAQGISSQLKTI